MQFFTDNILLIFILPLITAIIAFAGYVFKFAISKNTVTYCTLVSTFTGLFFAAGLYYSYGYALSEPLELSIGWMRIGDLNISLGVLFDNISSLFLLILMLISLLVQWYSMSYMKDDNNFNLYFCYLNLFNVAMSALILSSNLPQTYIFWELVGIFSYILVNFYYEKTQASNSAQKVFIVNRIGDMMFLSGIIILIYFLANYPISEGDVLLAYTDLPNTAADFYVYLSDGSFYLACMLLFGGAIAKSAQFPLQTWLIDAMQAPVPVSALIHAATMVAAGIFLTIRLMPMFELSAPVLNTVMYIGLFTALICAFFAIAQTDIKKMLAYSTSSQLGIMMASIGALAPYQALFYLTAHAFAKALLFLIAGILITIVAGGSQKMDDMKGCRKNYPVLAFCYSIAVISISGILFGGFYAKEGIFEQLIAVNQTPAVIMFVLTIFMTSYYLFKSYFVIFEGDGNLQEKKPIPISMNISVIICTVLVILTAFLNQNSLYTGMTGVFAPKIFRIVPVSLLISVLAAILACYITSNKKRYLPDFLKKLSLNGCYISNFYDWTADNIIDFFRNFAKAIDKYIIDAFINFQAYIARFLSWCISAGQNGNIQTYISYAIFSIAVLFFLYLLLIIGFGVM